MNTLNEQLIEASKKGDLNKVKGCIKDGADVHFYFDDAFCWAANNGHFDVVKYLVEECGADVHVRNDSAVCFAATNGNIKVLKYLVEDRGVNVHDDFVFPHTALYGQLEIVKYLVEDCGVNVHAGNDCAFRYAIQNEQLEILKYLKGYAVSQFIKRHIDKQKEKYKDLQNIDFVSKQYQLPFEIQQLISSYM